MSDVAPISGSSVGRPEPSTPAPHRAESRAPSRSADEAQISDRARYLAMLQQPRPDVIARARAEIAAGTYETDERLDAAVEALLRVLDVPA